MHIEDLKAFAIYYLKAFSLLALCFIGTMGFHYLFFNPYISYPELGFFYSWNWFHYAVLIPLFWWIMPPLSLVIGIKLLIDYKVINNFNLNFFNKIPKWFYYIYFIALISLNLGTLSQVSGGCIWQLPNFIYYPEYYQWRRFGFRNFSPTFLFFFYSFIYILSSIALYKFYFAYLRKKKTKSK